MQQRSKEWFNARRGKATASEIINILGIKGLGQIGETYAFEKAVELVYGLDEEDNFTSFDMQRGINLEPLAFKKLQEISFFEVQETSFFAYGDNAGASPDALVGKDAIAEIKCPRPNKFFNLVANGEKEIDKKYIAQMQFQMLCTNSVRCHFFNYIIYNGIEMWHEIIILKDENFINLIKQRILEFVKIRDKYILQLQQKQQF